jgi:hypothetical protein
MVKKRFFVTMPTAKQGRAAKRYLLEIVMENPFSDKKSIGLNKAAITATGIYRSHLRNNPGSSNLDKRMRGSALGIYVTIVIPIMIRKIFCSMTQSSPQLLLQKL